MENQVNNELTDLRNDVNKKIISKYENPDKITDIIKNILDIQTTIW